MISSYLTYKGIKWAGGAAVGAGKAALVNNAKQQITTKVPLADESRNSVKWL